MSNLIILGGGFAGVWAAMSAAAERKRLGGDDVAITLVSKDPYRRGSDFLLVDEAGHSKVSMEDFAVAMMDEAETPTENVKRVTVAY